MRDLCASLERRTLLSLSFQTVTDDYKAVLGATKVLSADLTSAAATYRTDSKLIAADIKALGKNRTNSLDITKLNKTVAGATALDARAMGKLISVAAVSLKRVTSAFSAVAIHPTAANDARVSAALTSLTTALIPYETVLATDTAAGDAKVAAALGSLVAANPTDTKLSTDVGTAETNSATALGVIANEVIITNTDIDTLAAAITGA
jgi:hypothetical protein